MLQTVKCWLGYHTYATPFAIPCEHCGHVDKVRILLMILWNTEELYKRYRKHRKIGE